MQIGDEAVQALSNFAETEKRQLAAWHEANARQEEMRAELNKAKGRADLLEDNNNELRGQMEQFTKVHWPKKSPISKQKTYKFIKPREHF